MSYSSKIKRLEKDIFLEEAHHSNKDGVLRRIYDLRDSVYKRADRVDNLLESTEFFSGIATVGSLFSGLMFLIGEIPENIKPLTYNAAAFLGSGAICLGSSNLKDRMEKKYEERSEYLGDLRDYVKYASYKGKVPETEKRLKKGLKIIGQSSQ